MHRYMKGARSERELLGRFYELGYSVLRAAGSGVNALGPDIIALRKGVCLSIECKAWDRSSLSLDPEQYQKLVEWERNTDGHTFVAWKVKNKGWYFIRLDEFSKGDRNYNVTMRKAFEINRGLDSVLAMCGTPVQPSAMVLQQVSQAQQQQ